MCVRNIVQVVRIYDMWKDGGGGMDRGAERECKHR